MDNIQPVQQGQIYATQRPTQTTQTQSQPVQKKEHNNKKKIMLALGGLAVLGASAIIIHKKGLDTKAIETIKRKFNNKAAQGAKGATDAIKDSVANNVQNASTKNSANVVDCLTNYTNGAPKDAKVNQLFEFDGGKLKTDSYGTEILESLDGTKAKVTTKDGVTAFYDFTGKPTRKIVDADGNIRITRLTNKPTNLAQDIQSKSLSVVDNKSMEVVNDTIKDLSSTTKAEELVKSAGKKVSQSKISDVKIDNQYQRAVEAYKKCKQEPTVANAKKLAKLIHPDRLINTSIKPDDKTVVEMNEFVSSILTAARKQ